MKVKFPNAGVSHQEKIEAGAAVLGSTASTYAIEITNLLEIQTGVLNNIYQSLKVIETVLSSGRSSGVVQALRKLESKKKKKKIPEVHEESRDDEEGEKKENNSDSIASEIDDDDIQNENIDPEVVSLSLHHNLSLSSSPASSSNRSPLTSLQPSKISSSTSMFSSSSSSSSSSPPAFSTKSVQSMAIEASKIPKALKKVAKLSGSNSNSKRRKVDTT